MTDTYQPGDLLTFELDASDCRHLERRDQQFKIDRGQIRAHTRPREAKAVEAPLITAADLVQYCRTGQTDDQKIPKWFNGTTLEFVELFASQARRLPPGWVMVPEEPTEEMIIHGSVMSSVYLTYKAMLAAAKEGK